MEGHPKESESIVVLKSIEVKETPFQINGRTKIDFELGGDSCDEEIIGKVYHCRKRRSTQYPGSKLHQQELAPEV